MAPSGGGGDGAAARHRDDAFVLYAFRVVELLAVDAALSLGDERVDRLVAVHAFVTFREPRAFSKSITTKLRYKLDHSLKPIPYFLFMIKVA